MHLFSLLTMVSWLALFSTCEGDKAPGEAAGGRDGGCVAETKPADAAAGKVGLPPVKCDTIEPVEGQPALALRTLISSGPALTDIAFSPADPGMALVLEQHTGKVRVLRNLERQEEPFLDLGDAISNGFEQGLLGIAFHPEHEQNRQVFFYYTDTSGTATLVRYQAQTDDPERADVATRTVFLRVAEPQSNHNGGGLRFGPDGYLHLTLGDGGGAGDSHGAIGNGQRTDTLLGKMLRLDVDRPACGKHYSIPPDNPFVGNREYRPEILHLGLRNAWRYTFDRTTGDLWIGDVGQNEWEELDYVPAGKKGLNLGWRCKEGNEQFKWDSHCPNETFTDPVMVKAINGSEGFCSIIPGHRYRGCRMPGYHGTVFYGDWCADHLRAFHWDGSVHKDRPVNGTDSPLQISGLSSWAEDAAGELYLTTTGGQLYKLVPAE